MKTDVITIYSDLNGRDKALQETEKFTEYYHITGKNAMHLRLLTEETFCMIHGIMEEFSGKLWLESEQTRKGLLCRICLTIEKPLNKEQEADILSVATSGKNEMAKGIVGKIRELIRQSLQSASDEDEEYMKNICDTLAVQDAGYWSLQLYRQSLSHETETKKQEHDELEKSIIASLANDVKVWLKTDITEITVEKLIME